MKPDCLTCVYRHPTMLGNSHHSSCHHPNAGGGDLALAILAIVDNSMEIKLNPHGVKNSWAFWPIDYDTIWLDNCNQYEEKK